MSFRGNAAQQLTICDILLALTLRELSALDLSWAKAFGDEVFPAIDESRFACLYSDVASRPNTPVNVIVGALILKEYFSLTDDGVVHALMFDVRWRYALHTTSFAEQPLSDKTLSRFRRRLLDHEEATGEDLLKQCVTGLASVIADAMGIDGSVRRMDSTMIESNVRDLSRAERIYECLANACRLLARRLGDSCPDRFAAYADRNHRNRFFFHDKDSTYEKRLETLFTDAESLVREHSADLAGSEQLALLERCMIEQTVVEGGKRRLRESEDGFKGSSMLQSPYDPDATFRVKAGKSHHGYVANLEESCGKGGTVVTNYDYRQNSYSDSRFLKDFIADCEPVEGGATLVTDGGYDGEENVEAAAEKGIELITTDLLGKEPNDVLADFEWSEDGTKLLACAGGFEPYACTHYEKSGQVRAKIDSYHCEGCPFAGECPATRKGITATIVASRKSTRRARYLRKMGSEEFEKYRRFRNGAETIPSMLKRKYRLDTLPRGHKRGKLFFGCKVAVLNFGKLLGFMRNTGNYAENPLLA